MKTIITSIPDIEISEKRHWKVGDGLDVNGGEYIGQIALVFLSDEKFEVRFYNTHGRHIMTTPGTVNVPEVIGHGGSIPKYEDFKANVVPKSRRYRAPEI